MRIDHVAYQQATRVAGFGLFLQLAIGLTLLIFGVVAGDTALQFASACALTGLIIWLSLVILFHQQKLERLESLEADELAQSRGTTIFDREIEATRVAARRLHLMHTWLMPAVSLLVALILIGFGVFIIRWFAATNEPDGPVFRVTGRLGWAMAICLGLALLSFICSRFVAGMARQPAWQNLRGGAGFMVANAVICLGCAVGFGFAFAQRVAVLESVAFGIAIFMLGLAAEILLNFILNLYRPRRVGETPRPAFDSRALSLLSAPDSIVRSINEAVNYQFGFDITSSWGYQLLLRSVTRLVVLAIVVMALLSCIATVNPDQQAVRLRFGAIQAIHGPGLMFKLPWPIETVEFHQVGRVRELSMSVNPIPAGQRVPPQARVNLWINEDPAAEDRRLFVTGASRLGKADSTGGAVPDGAEESAADARVGARFSLVDAEVMLHYRVRPDGLEKFLAFGTEAVGRRATLTARERGMRALALRELCDHLSQLPLEDVLSPGRSGILDGLRQRVQARFDAPEHDVGVEVVAITASTIRPPSGAADKFEEFSISVQARRQEQDIAQRAASVTMAVLAGGEENAARLVAKIDQMLDLQKNRRFEEATALKIEIEQALVASRGQPAAMIESAEAGRWRTQMQARTDANRLAGDLPMFEAAPQLYRERQKMRVLSQMLPSVRVKYLLGVPPERVQFDLEMLETDAALNFLDNVEQNPNRADEG